jgi:hypothetical protein
MPIRGAFLLFVFLFVCLFVCLFVSLLSFVFCFFGSLLLQFKMMKSPYLVLEISLQENLPNLSWYYENLSDFVSEVLTQSVELGTQVISPSKTRLL